MAGSRREIQTNRQANDNKAEKVPPVSHRHYCAFLALSLATLLAACSNGSPALISVNGTTITKAQYDHQLANSQAANAELADMIQGLALEQYAAARGITVTDAEMAQAQARLESTYRPGMFEEYLRTNGLTEADFKTLLRRRILLDHLVGNENAVTEKEMADFYRKNPFAFNRPAQVRARQILVPDLATAKMIEAKLKAGGDFQALARQYSTDRPSRENGGDLGYFSGGDVVPELVKAAFAQKVGTISAPVKSSFGYHIIWVLDHRPEFHPTFAQAHDQIRDRIWQIHVARESPKVLQDIVENHMQVTVYDQHFAGLPNAIRTSAQSPL